MTIFEYKRESTLANRRRVRRMTRDVMPSETGKALLWSVLAVLALMLALPAFGLAETLTVTATELNGRAQPNLKASVEARFFKGDELECVAHDGQWAEVVGGETGTVWCSIDYLTEREPFKAVNDSGGAVNVREYPGSEKRVGAIKRGRTVTVERLVMGYGFIGTGWVDMAYLTEVDE